MLLPRDRLTEEQYRSGRGFGFISMMVGRIGERKKKEKKRERERENSGRRLRVSISLFSSIAYVMKKNGRREGGRGKKRRVLSTEIINHSEILSLGGGGDAYGIKFYLVPCK